MKTITLFFSLCFTRSVSWVAIVLAGISLVGPQGGALSVSGATVDACPPPAGTMDSSFHRVPDPVAFEGMATVLRELPNGKLMVGMFQTFSTGGAEPVTRDVLVRLNEDGTLDPSFVFTSTNFYRVMQTHALAVSSNGLMAVATSGYGTFGFFHGHFHLLRPDGSVIFAADVGCDCSAQVRALAWQPDGRLLIGGNYGLFLPGLPAGVARLLPGSGAVDPSFTPPPNLGTVAGLAVQTDGRILVRTWDSLLRLLPSGALDPTWQVPSIDPYGPGLPEPPSPILLDGSGRILVGGLFTEVNGVPRSGVARFLSNGALDMTFDPGSGPGPSWNGMYRICMALERDGKILVGGSFTSFSGADRIGLARLRGDGSLDPSFNSGTLVRSVQSIHVRQDGRILVTEGAPSWGGSMSPFRLLADPRPRLEPPELIQPGSVRLRLDSVPGAEYVLETSVNLTSWSDVGVKQAHECTLAFTNSPPAGAASFYRIRRPTETELGR